MGVARPELSAAAAVAQAAALAGQGGRFLLGLAGAPGAGKSHLAARIARALGPDRVVVVGMDGFHLANAVLADLGRADRKGAPDTFDVAGYAALLRRIRCAQEPITYAPEFRRDLEEPIAQAVAVPASVPLVITEGNYLLLPDPAWEQVRTQLDEVWFVRPAEDLRQRRLISRHESFGRSPQAARAWALGTDEANARVVLDSAHLADRTVLLD